MEVLEVNWTSLVAQMIKNLPAMQDTWVWSLSREDPLEQDMATHSSILTWRIPWTEEPGRLLSMGAQRIGDDWMTNTISLSLQKQTISNSNLLTCTVIIFSYYCICLLLIYFSDQAKFSKYALGSSDHHSLSLFLVFTMCSNLLTFISNSRDFVTFLFYASVW